MESVIPGVEIHAQLLKSILLDEHFTRLNGIDALEIGARADDVHELTEFDEGPLPADWIGELQRRGIGGTVTLLLTYDTAGNVIDVAVESSSGQRELDRSAMTAARRWKINPGMRNGQKIGGVARVPVTFTP